MPSSVAKKSCRVCPGRRAKAAHRDLQEIACPKHLSCIPCSEHRNQFASFRFARSGMCNSRLANAPGILPSRRTNRGPISFFSSSSDPATQDFDLKSAVFQTLAILAQRCFRAFTCLFWFFSGSFASTSDVHGTQRMAKRSRCRIGGST